MKLLVMSLVASAAAMPGMASAADNERALQLKPKAAIMSSAVVATTSVHEGNAPFVSPVGEPELVLTPRSYQVQDASRTPCEHALCYDSASGRMVYKPARQFMPDLPGLQPENISLKRNQIVFRYSF